MPDFEQHRQDFGDRVSLCGRFCPGAARSGPCDALCGRWPEGQGRDQALQRLSQQCHGQSHRRPCGRLPGDAAHHRRRLLSRDGTFPCTRHAADLAASVRVWPRLSRFHRTLRICAVDAVAGGCGADRAGVARRLSRGRRGTAGRTGPGGRSRGAPRRYHLDAASRDADRALGFSGRSPFLRQTGATVRSAASRRPSRRTHW